MNEVRLYVVKTEENGLVKEVALHTFPDLLSVTTEVDADAGMPVSVEALYHLWDANSDPIFPILEVNPAELDGDDEGQEEGTVLPSFEVVCYLDEVENDGEFDDDGRRLGEYLVELFEDQDFIHMEGLTILYAPWSWHLPDYEDEESVEESPDSSHDVSED